MKVLAFKDTHTSRKEIDISGRALTMSGLIPAHSKDSEFSSFYSKTSQRGSNMGSIISVVGKTTVEIIELFKCTQKVP